MSIVRKGILLGALLVLVGGLARSQDVIPSDREELLKGAGMGLASFGERNSYPGPKHVIDLKEDLALNRDQIKKTETLVTLVKVSAVAKGEEIIQAEEELNSLFEAGTINEKTLRGKLERIGKLRADLRFIHLQAHLRVKQILTPEQVKQYNELRGYESKPQN